VKARFEALPTRGRVGPLFALMGAVALFVATLSMVAQRQELHGLPRAEAKSAAPPSPEPVAGPAGENIALGRP
jgi:hypothetical protein